MGEGKVPNRWVVAIAGTVLQLCLGTVYAWSFFQKPVVTTFGWSNSQAAWAFSFAICFLGLAAAWGGINLAKHGPKKLALTGSVLFSSGYLLGALAFSMKSLIMLYVGYGMVGGIGLGLCYVTPVATAAKWFPDKKGFITGMVVMGFGFGALLMSKIIAPIFMEMTGENLVSVFLYIGILMFVLTIPTASLLVNPPAGFVPAGYTPPAAGASAQKGGSAGEVSPREALSSPKFMMMWLVFFLNITAGIMFIGFQSPMMQDLLKSADPSYGSMAPEVAAKALAAAGATLIAISSVFNGVGRFFWGGVSDKIGRTNAFRLILLTQACVFAALLFVRTPLVFGALVCYVLLCYGGGFGTMPSFVLDVFGNKLMSTVYGVILTAWSLAGIVGPQVVATITDVAPASAASYTFIIGGGLLAVGFVVALFLRDSAFARPEGAGAK